MSQITPKCAFVGCPERSVHLVAARIDVSSYNTSGLRTYLDGEGVRDVPVCVSHYEAVSAGAIDYLSLGVAA